MHGNKARSAAMKRYWANLSEKDRKRIVAKSAAGNRGKKRSKEGRLNMSLAAMGRKRSASAKIKTSKSLKRFYASPKGKLSAKRQAKRKKAYWDAHPEQLKEKGSKGSKTLKKHWESLPKNQRHSKAERAVQNCLKRLKVKHRLHTPLGPYIVDFFLSESKTVIECDGPQHNSTVAKKRDHRRDVFLRGLGMRVIRIPNELIFADVAAVVSKALTVYS